MVLPQNALEEQLLGLYGISLVNPEDSHPLFGSSVQLPLQNGFRRYIESVTSDHEGALTVKYEPTTTMTLPTLHQLGYHFGFMRFMRDTTTNFIRQSRGTISGKDLPRPLLGALESQAERRFENAVIRPARRDLQQAPQPCYFYCVPSLSQEVDLLTGNAVQKKGPPVLTLLPMSTRVAQYYQLDETVVATLARQVVWVIRHLCARTIHTPEQLMTALDGWLSYLDPLSLQGLQQDIQEHHPYLASPALTQKLLPSVGSAEIPQESSGKEPGE